MQIISIRTESVHGNWKQESGSIMKNNDILFKFVGDQLSRWPLACDNYRALKNVRVREVETGGLTVKLQFNPARIISSAARLDKADIAKRKCFLCRENRPAEQDMLKFEGRKGKKYHILVNPYPIFPDHLVIAAVRHTDQSIWHRYVDM
jgi:ATP adenylyltransferase/5',5'''-P-1,P-4-tetraphosphate phosphorylase II